MLLMTCITEVNHSDFRFGLNFARTTRSIGATVAPSRPVMNAFNSRAMIDCR